jgi:hypothetical protein
MTLRELLFQLTDDQPMDPVEVHLDRVGDLELHLSHPNVKEGEGLQVQRMVKSSLGILLILEDE